MASYRRAIRFPAFPLAGPPVIRGERWRLGVGVFLGLLALWIALSMLLGRGEVRPGVLVGPVPVGGMSPGEAHRAIDARVAALVAEPVTVTIDGRTWTPLPAELGITMDIERAVDDAMAYGRDNHVVAGTLHAAHLSPGEVVVPVPIHVDAAILDGWLDGAERELGDARVDAEVRIDGEAITVVPARAGQAVDREAFRNAIAGQLLSFEPATVETRRTHSEPAVSTGEAERASDHLRAITAEPLVLSRGEESWTIAPERILAMLDAAPDPDNAGALIVGLKPGALDTLVAEIAGEIDQAPGNAYVQDLDSHKRLAPEREGRTVDRPALASAIADALATGERTVAVPVTDVVMPDTTADEVARALGITDMIAVGDSVYAGSGRGRARNIEHAARMVDGTLVPPGGTFSFNDAVGSVFDGSYVDAGSYIDGPNGQSLAGGICQVSTTVYRAALVAGFPIVEWWPHSYRTPFYELGGWRPGYDASIVQHRLEPEANSDFRFRNPTDAWLLIRVEVTDDSELRVELLGTPTGYDVEFDEPEIEVIEEAPDEVTIAVEEDLPPGTVLEDQPAMDGLKVVVVRRVSGPDGETISVDTFVSTYGAYGPIRRVSPDMEDAALEAVD